MATTQIPLVAQIERLVREQWPNATMLSEELYAVLKNAAISSQSVDASNNQTGSTTNIPGVNPSQSGNLANPDISIGGFGSGGFNSVFQIGGFGINFVGPDASGQTNPQTKQVPGVPPDPTPNFDVPSDQPDNATQALPAICGIGKVISGSGSTYQVELRAAVQNKSGTMGIVVNTVTVTQLQIDPSETIPAGTWTAVFRVGSLYYMQVPVFLDDSGS